MTTMTSANHTTAPDTSGAGDRLGLSSETFFSDRRSLFFISILYFSDSLLICSGRWITDSAGWIAVLLAGLISAPLVLLFGRLTRNRGVGLAFLLLSKAVAVFIIGLSLFLFAHFLNRCVNIEVAGWLIPAFIFLTAAFAAFKDFAIIKRSASVLAAVSAIFLAVAFILLWNRIEISNIHRLFQDAGSFFTQLAVFTAVFSVKGILLTEILRVENAADRTDSRIIGAGLMASASLIAAIQLVSLTVLGDRLYSLIEYPVYYPLGMTKYGDYFERTEVISLAVFMITLTFKCSVLMRIVFPHRASREEKTPAQNTAAASPQQQPSGSSRVLSSAPPPDFYEAPPGFSKAPPAGSASSHAAPSSHTAPPASGPPDASQSGQRDKRVCQRP